jgi:RNA polymerase sigma-70 factor, ECF subfamily
MLSGAEQSASRWFVAEPSREGVRSYVLTSVSMTAQLEHDAHVGIETDAVLARRATGCVDREAEAELCRRFAPRIRLYGLKHLRDEDKARDLVQSVLATVIEMLRAGRVEDLERIDRFMLGTARNLSLRMRQKDGRATPMAPEQLPEIAAAVSAGEAHVDIEALMKCVGRLEQRAQTVLHLSFYRDKQADEIATVLETTPGNVRVMRYRALAQLRDCLAAREVA